MVTSLRGYNPYLLFIFIMRLDKFLAEKHSASRQYIQKLIKEGRVLSDGTPAQKDQRITPNAVITIDWPSLVSPNVEPENIPLEILYQDEDLAVINKPAGLVTHPYGRITSGTLVNALLYHLKDLSGIGGVQRPGIVHRLDKETSGLMVVAKNDFSHRFLSEEFRGHRVDKRYLAFVQGVIPWSEQEVVIPIRHREDDWTAMTFGFRKGRESQTMVRVKRTFPSASLVEVYPKTGRTHQVRVVMDFLGFPLIGDKRYGGKNPFERLIARQALHAASLSFRHPATGQTLSFSIPLPPDLEKLRQDLTILKI